MDDMVKKTRNDNIWEIMVPHISIFIDKFYKSMTLSSLLFLLNEGANVGEKATWFGIMMSSYSAIEALGTIISGILSGYIGRRLTFVITLFGTIFLMLSQTLAPDLTSLFALRLLAGLFGAVPPAAQAYLMDLIIISERPKHMSYMIASRGLALIFGSLIGGGYVIFSFHIPYYATSCLCMIISLISLFWLIKSQNPTDSMPINPMSTEEIKQYVNEHRPQLNSIQRMLIFYTFLCGFSFQSNIVAFPLFAKANFGFYAEDVSAIFIICALVCVLVTAFLFNPIQRDCGLEVTSIMGNILLGVGMIIIPLFKHLTPIFIGLVAISIGHAFNEAATITILSNVTGKKKYGTGTSICFSCS